MKRKTHDEYVKELHEKRGEEYTVLSQYINNRTKIWVRHNSPKCDFYKWPTNPYTLLKGHGCFECYGTPKKSSQEFDDEIRNLTDNEYFLSGEYTTAQEITYIYHTICEKEFLMTPNNFLNGQRCSHCNRRNVPRTTEQFKKEVYDLVKEEYDVLGEIEVDSSTKLLMRHNSIDCNFYVYPVSPHKFLTGRRCPKCYGSQKKTTEEFIELVKEKVGYEYEVRGEYINSDIHINMFHIICKNEYPVSPGEFLYHGRRCPFCNESKGEKRITKFLQSKGVEFKRQFRFSDCVDKRPLPFDFAIVKNNELIFLIEYDGEQHFIPNDAFGGEEGLFDRQRKDQIKTQYCIDMKIRLIRIPYYDFDFIEEILAVELAK